MGSQKTKLWRGGALTPAGQRSNEPRKLESLVRTKIFRFAAGESPSGETIGPGSEQGRAPAEPQSEPSATGRDLVITRFMPIERLFPELASGSEKAGPQETGGSKPIASDSSRVDFEAPDRWAALERRLRDLGSALRGPPSIKRAAARRELRIAVGVLAMAIAGGRMVTSRLQATAGGPTAQATVEQRAIASTPGAEDLGRAGAVAYAEGGEKEGETEALAYLEDDQLELGPDPASLADEGEERAAVPPTRNRSGPGREAQGRASPLARTAVDALASGDLAAAAELYERLASTESDRLEYAEAARILRARVAARASQ